MTTLSIFLSLPKRIPVLAFLIIIGIYIGLGLLTQLTHQSIKQYEMPKRQFSTPHSLDIQSTTMDNQLLVTTETTKGKLNVSIPTQSPTQSLKVIHSYLKEQRSLCEKAQKSLQVNASSLLCDCVPETLLGASADINLNPVPLEETVANNVNVQPGGHWEPNNCTARYRVVIIIPFRDRHSHLSTLLHYLHPILQGQQINYTIVVVEQHLPNTFNKAVMMNIGYQYAVIKHNADCVIFHDVDFIPEDGRHLYRCQDKPVHLGAFHDSHEYKIIYGMIFGGVTALTPAQFKKANGYSNLYFGWGGEDDDMWYRIRDSKQRIIRDPREVAGYRVINHKRDKGNIQLDRTAMLHRLFHDRHQDKDGLNTLKYVLRDVQLYPLYTWLLADVGPDRL